MSMWRKQNLCVLLVRMQLCAATKENSMESPQKLKVEPPYDPEVTLLGVYSKRAKHYLKKIAEALILIVALFTTAETWNNLSVYPWIMG